MSKEGQYMVNSEGRFCCNCLAQNKPGSIACCWCGFLFVKKVEWMEKSFPMLFLVMLMLLVSCAVNNSYVICKSDCLKIEGCPRLTISTNMDYCPEKMLSSCLNTCAGVKQWRLI